MEALDAAKILERMCGATKKWGMHITIWVPDGVAFEEMFEACTFLSLHKHGQIIVERSGWFLFDTDEEMQDHYWQCVGDDGPTKVNPYNGKVRVYALTCSPEGQLLQENT